MSAPEIINVNLNAADGWQRFVEMGLSDAAARRPAPEQIQAMLGRQAGRLFRVAGFVVEPPADVLLRVRGAQPEGIRLASTVEPAFEDVYSVAAEPPPSVTQHGDYQFCLLRVPRQQD